MPRAHFVHHVPFEGPAGLSDWASGTGFDITTTWQHEQDPLPEATSLDLVIITGGPMGVYEEELYPWMDAEKRWIKELLAAKVPLMGICLGAQFIADAMGAPVAPMGHKEIGWFPIRRTTDSAQIDWLPELPDPMPVLHWHGDQFGIPDGTTCLWSSDRCPHQAFTGPDVLGLQFHLEMGFDHLTTLIDHARHELSPDTDGIQSETDMLGNQARFKQAREHATSLLNAWWKGGRTVR